MEKIFFKKSNSSFTKLLFLTIGLTLTLGISGCKKEKPVEKEQTPQAEKFSAVVLKTPANNPQIDSDKPLQLEVSALLKIETVKNSLSLKDENSYSIYASGNYSVDYKDRIISIKFTNEQLQNKSANYKVNFDGVQDSEGLKVKIPEFAFRLKDAIPPQFKSSNIQDGKINSANPVILTFSEALQSATGISLKKNDGSNWVDTDASKYSLTFISQGNLQDKTKLQLKLTDADLKKANGAYRIVFGEVKDLENNKLASTPNIEFEFLESTAPELGANNLGNLVGTGATAKYELKSNQILEFSFNEALSATSISTTSVILKNSKNQALSANDYKVELDPADPKKIRVYLTNYKLKNQTETYTLTLTANIKDVNLNQLKLDENGTNSFKIEFKDSIYPIFKNSNIFDKKVLEGTKKISLAFSEALSDASKDLIEIKKASTNFTDFTASFSEDKHNIILAFNSAHEPQKSAQYKVIIPATILDVAGNKLRNPQTLEFEVLENSKAIFVKPKIESPQTGDSWANATQLQDAIDKAFAATPDKKIVLVAKGSYYADPLQTTLEKSFELKDGVKIYGGFDTENPDAPRNLQASILEADMGNDHKTKILLKAQGVSNSSLLDAFVLQNADNSDKNQAVAETLNCAAIKLENSSPVFNNLLVRNNKTVNELSAKGNGAAICNLNNSNPIIKNSIFIKNEAAYGGAIYNDNSSPTISKTIFVENEARNGGGAISSNETSTPKIISSIFIKNTADVGGAIYDSNNSKTKITNATFVENSAVQGGAITVDSNSQMQVYNSIFWKNKAWWDAKTQKPDTTKKQSRPSSVYIFDTKSNLDLQNSALHKDSYFAGKNQIQTIDFSSKNNKTQDAQMVQIDEFLYAPLKTTTITSIAIDTGNSNLYNKVTGAQPNAIDETDFTGAARQSGASIDLGAIEVLD